MFIEGISDADLIAGCFLSFFSFLASVIQGSTSLGDGIFLQISWGILTQLAPWITTESSLGADGLRVITMFMYARLVVIPPYLLWRLWSGHQANQKKDELKWQQEMKEYEQQQQQSQNGLGVISSSPTFDSSSALTIGTSVVVSSTSSNPNPTLISSPPTKPEKPAMFSPRLFWLLAVPNVFWCIMGVVILQNVKSQQIAVYLGTICITFSFLYMALKMWKVSPARHSMPLWLQHLLSPQFLVEGTKDKITLHAQISAFLAFNLSGLMTTLAGIGGPPMMIFILLYEMPMNMTRFTFPVGTLIGAFFRLFYSLYSGVLPFHLWPFYLPAVVTGLIGINIGVGIGNVLSPSMFSATIFCLLILAGTVMLTKNPYVTVTAMVLACAGLLLKQFWWDKRGGEENSVDGPNILTTPTTSGVMPTKPFSPICVLHLGEEDLDRHSKYCDEAEGMEMIS